MLFVFFFFVSVLFKFLPLPASKKHILAKCIGDYEEDKMKGLVDLYQTDDFHFYR